MRIRTFLLGIFLSIFAYIAIFGFFVKKPILYGGLDSMIAKKYGRLEALQGRKFVLLAGSNGRYSHSAKIIGDFLGMDAVNLSIAASLSIDWQLDLMKKHLRAGDIVYLPLEPHNYCQSETDAAKADEGIYCFIYKKKQWLEMPLKKKIYTFYNADLSLIFEDILERAMLLAKISPRKGAQNEVGDETGHTPERSKEYAAYISTQKGVSPYRREIDYGSYSMTKLSEFLEWAKSGNIRVFGGLPTTLDTAEIPHGYIAKLEKFYAERGHKFIVLDNKSQYDASLFYDTAYHLNNRGQELHSKQAAEKIKAELPGNN